MSAELLAAIRPILNRVRRDDHAAKGREGTYRTGTALTDALVLAHLDGSGSPRGAYIILPGEDTCRLALFDFDSHKGATSWPEMCAVALQVMDAMRERGLKPRAFRSTGGNGIHVFVLWQDPQDAFSVRTLMTQTLEACGLKPGTAGVANGEVEVFPKQDRVDVGKWGNMFILPLAGKSEPLDDIAGDLELMGRDYRAPWEGSAPVPLAERPERVEQGEPVTVEGPELKRLQAALAAIDNDEDGLSYEDWCRVVWGVHSATGGSAEGYAMAREFSERSFKFEEVEFEEKVWGHADRRGGGDGPRVTVASVYAMAREAGWEDRVEPEDFPLLPMVKGDVPPPKLERDKAGKVLPTARNLEAVLNRPDVLGMDIRFDAFQQHLVLAEYTEFVGGEQWLPFADADYQEVTLRLESLGFKTPGRQAIRDAVDHRARAAQIDTAMFWAATLSWDGRPRIDGFMAKYFAADDTPYNAAVSAYAWTAMAGRLMEPGCQADMVPILFGGQGAGKSSGVAAMVPAKHLRLMGFDQPQEALSRLMRGALVVEIAELNGLRSRAIEGIKSWITRRHEEWVPKYKEFAVTMGRRCVFWGTTNDDEIFDDPTGERRWLPVKVGEVVDVEAIKRDRDQLWAEALVRWREGGVEWQAAEALARAEHAAFRVHDTWEEALGRWAQGDQDGTSPMEAGFTTRDALVEALGFSDKQIRRTDEMRCAKALKVAGFEQKQERRTGEKIRVWRQVEQCPNLPQPLD